MTGLLLLAIEEDEVAAGPLGLVILLLLLIATFLLIRNMSGRIKRLPRDFPEQDDDPTRTPPKD